MPAHVIANDTTILTEEIRTGSSTYMGVETSQPLLMQDANVITVHGVVKARSGGTNLRLRMQIMGTNDLASAWFVVATYENSSDDPRLVLSTGTELGESAPQSFTIKDPLALSFRHVRVRWVLYYVTSGNLAAGDTFVVTAHAGLGRMTE